MKDLILRCGDMTAHVNAFGAELKGLALNGLEYLYDGDPFYYGRTSPTLFPVVGRFLSDTYYEGNRAYHMDMNGFAMNRNFVTERQSDSAATFRLCADERTRASYPFAFVLRVTYALDGRGISVTYAVENHGAEDMPFCLGCHTAYRWPLLDGEDPNDYALRFEREESLVSFNPFNWREEGFVSGKARPLSHALFENYTRSMTHIRSEWIELAHAQSGHGVRIHRAEMPYLAMWTLPDEGARFVCLEPCTGVHAGAATTLHERDGSITLRPGGRAERRFSIELF